jgi:hypothetical protein
VILSDDAGRFATFDRSLKRRHANKEEPPLVRDRPQPPRHTNGSQRDLRPQVIRRKAPARLAA